MPGMQFGTDSYREGALERLQEAQILMRAKSYGGSIYLAGLAVEAMLRSLVWLRHRKFDEKHDLRKIAVRIEELGLLRSGERDDDFVAIVQAVAARWTNNMRFAGSSQIEKWFSTRKAAPNRKIGLRQICEKHYEDGTTVINRCEVLWQRHR